MAFHGGGTSGELIRHNERDSLWGVKRGTPQYGAWEDWYRSQFRKTFFPEWLTVPMEWPPTTESGAQMVSKWLSDIRDSRYGKEALPISTIPVPRNPVPWGGKARVA